MAYDEGLARRILDHLGNDPGLEERRMFGGWCVLLYGNMVAGVYQDRLIIRVGEERARALLTEEHVRPFDVTGRPMKGWAMVEPQALESDEAFKRFVDHALGFVRTLPAK